LIPRGSFKELDSPDKLDVPCLLYDGEQQYNGDADITFLPCSGSKLAQAQALIRLQKKEILTEAAE